MASTVTPPSARTGSRSGIVLVALALSTFIFVTVESMPIGLLTWMAPSLHVRPSAIGWLVTGYGVVVATTSVPLARWTLRFSRRPLMLWVFGLFSVSLLGTAAAPGYGWVLAGRVVTALVHAVFWSIVPTTAASLFSAEVRSRVVPALFTGSSLGTVAGVPAAAWLGLHHGWRTSFLVAGLFAAALFLVLLALLPAPHRGEETAALGTEPDRRQYAVLLAVCALGIGAMFTFQTYVTLFLTKAVHFAPSSLGLLLLVGGLGGLLGVGVGGWRVARAPYQSLVLALASGAAVLLALTLWPVKPVSVVGVVLAGTVIGAVATVVQVRVLAVAPGSTDVASAGSSSMFNVGIAGGALLGSLLVAGPGVRWVPLAGCAVATVATAVLLGPGRPNRSTADPAR